MLIEKSEPEGLNSSSKVKSSFWAVAFNYVNSIIGSGIIGNSNKSSKIRCQNGKWQSHININRYAIFISIPKLFRYSIYNERSWSVNWMFHSIAHRVRRRLFINSDSPGWHNIWSNFISGLVFQNTRHFGSTKTSWYIFLTLQTSNDGFLGCHEGGIWNVWLRSPFTYSICISIHW